MNATERASSETDIADRLRRLEGLPLAGVAVLVDAHVADAHTAAQLVAALRSLVGTEGTIVMPAFTQNQTLLESSARPVAFHADLEVDAALGRASDAFRRNAGCLRSIHPTNSFAACGARSQMLLSTNLDNNPLGPVKKLNLLNALSLRIDRSAAFYTPYFLAELQALPGLRYRGTAKRINIAGFEERVVIDRIATCTAGFAAIDAGLADSSRAQAADGISLQPLRVLVRAAASAIASAPEQLLCGRTDCADCTTRRAAIARGAH